MEKISKIKDIKGNGTWDSPNHGLFYKYEYQFEDGQVLNAQHKSENPFKVGDTVQYEVKGTNDYGDYGKVSKAPQQQSSKDDYVKGIEVGHAINNAVNMICAGVELDVEVPTGTTEEKIYLYAQKVMAIANRLKQE